jgi:hypothetical protein
MTRPTMASVETQKVQEIAQRYRDQGYEVTLAPKGDELPDALRTLPPDLIARKGGDVVVVEVKSRPSLSRPPRPSDLARVVREQTDWRFELVIVNPERQIPAPYDAQDWNEEDVQSRLREAKTLLDAGHVEAALLLGWSATEATLRLLAEREGLPLERMDPPYLLKRLATSAVLRQQEYNRFWSLFELRNAVAHGLKPTQLDASDAQALVKATARLLRPLMHRKVARPKRQASVTVPTTAAD